MGEHTFGKKKIHRLVVIIIIMMKLIEVYTVNIILTSPLACFRIQNKYTPRSDVWSFAVTLWEILTFAREQPYEELSDQHVIDNVTRLYQNDGNFVSFICRYYRLITFYHDKKKPHRLFKKTHFEFTI